MIHGLRLYLLFSDDEKDLQHIYTIANAVN